MDRGRRRNERMLFAVCACVRAAGVFLVLAPVGLTIAWFVILGVMLCSVAGLEARRWWYASRQAKLSRETKQESMHKEVSMMITATNNSAQI